MYLNILESSTKLGIDNRKLTLEEMVSKLQEEVTELKEAVKNKDNIDHISEEAWDSLQMSIEVLDNLKEQHNVNLEESLNKHHKKIKERGWKAERMLVFHVSKKCFNRKEAPEVPAQEQLKKLDLSQVSIKNLADELAKRKDCVTKIIAEPYEKYSISMEYNGTITDLGPAIILKIID